ncbi:hypothetical protein [Thalassotalea sp. PLHSN55]|uniref:hypothetical protein n=1 Tax=Thalassotalea sp. PLHSN55 TaxID=3435888 RepID=UPI003F8770BB
MNKLNNFIGQALLAFLPALLVAVTSHYNLLLSGQFSFSFAVVGVCFSIFYMGQRAYIAINGALEGSLYKEFVFRNINLFLACLVSTILCLILDVTLWLAFCAMAIKLSESPIELHNGIAIKYEGSKKAAQKLCVASVVRAIFIVVPFLLIPPSNEDVIKIYTCYYLLLSAFVYWLYKHKVSRLNNSAMKVRVNYFKNLGRLKVFALATIACSLLSALPRLVTSPSGNENSIILIALSVSPALAVIFQAIWLANINKLNHKSFKSLVFFYLEILAIFVVIIISLPIWSLLIPIVYGVSTSSEVEIFADVVVAMCLFFSAMTLMNCFKFYTPKLEMVAYIGSSLVLLLSSFSNVELLTSLYYSAFIMFIFSLIPPLIHLKNRV